MAVALPSATGSPATVYAALWDMALTIVLEIVGTTQ